MAFFLVRIFCGDVMVLLVRSLVCAVFLGSVLGMWYFEDTFMVVGTALSTVNARGAEW